MLHTAEKRISVLCGKSFLEDKSELLSSSRQEKTAYSINEEYKNPILTFKKFHNLFPKYSSCFTIHNQKKWTKSSEYKLKWFVII